MMTTSTGNNGTGLMDKYTWRDPSTYVKAHTAQTRMMEGVHKPKVTMLSWDWRTATANQHERMAH